MPPSVSGSPRHVARRPSAGGMLRGSWVSPLPRVPVELARSDGQSGSHSEPEVGFWESSAASLRIEGSPETRTDPGVNYLLAPLATGSKLPKIPLSVGFASA